MSGKYELWDLEGRNCVGAYETEAEALVDVQETLRHYGSRGVASLALGWENERGELVTIAEGADLVARAERQPASA